MPVTGFWTSQAGVYLGGLAPAPALGGEKNFVLIFSVKKTFYAKI